jgi:HK97 family phage portal protein
MRVDLSWRFPFFHKFNEERATVNVPRATFEYLVGGLDYTSESGIIVDSDTALTLSAVWRAISIISQTISTLPLSLYRKLSNGDRELLVDHPAIQLINNPNELATPILFKEALQTSVLTWGNGYGYITRTRSYEPKELKPLDPQKVTVRTEGKSVFYDVQGLGTGIDSERILHIPGLSFNGITGKSPIEVARNSLGGGLAVQKFGNKFFANGAKSSGILKHPGRLGDKGIENLRRSFDKKMAKDEGGTMILEEGVEYIPLTIPPDQAQFLASKKFTVEEVARWFGVPPHLLSDLDRSTFNNIEHQGIEFVQYSLMPWIKRWEEELARKLLREDEKKDHFFRFNINGLMRGDAKTRAEYYRLMLDLGVLNINEVRNLEEFNDIPGGNQHLVQVNRMPLDKIGNDGTEN